MYNRNTRYNAQLSKVEAMQLGFQALQYDVVPCSLGPAPGGSAGSGWRDKKSMLKKMEMKRMEIKRMESMECRAFPICCLCGSLGDTESPTASMTTFKTSKQCSASSWAFVAQGLFEHVCIL